MSTREERKEEAKRIKKLSKRIGNPLSLLVTGEHPALAQVSVDVQKTDDLSYVDQMLAVLLAARNGVGLAANQIGVCTRVILIWPRRFTQNGAEGITTSPEVMINPVILDHHGDPVDGEEGCLSYPGRRVRIARWPEIFCCWMNREWEPQTASFSGFEARVVQHEIDHLFGVCQVGTGMDIGMMAPPAEVQEAHAAYA